MTTHGGDWARLAREVETRRKWLGLSQSGLARRGGPSHETVRLIEKQARESFRDMTLSQLDRGLQWKAGIARDIVYGDPPADHRKWEADLTADEIERQAHAVAFGRGGTEPLPVSLDNISDFELASAMVNRLTRAGTARENLDLLGELMELLTRLSGEEDDTPDTRRTA